MKKLNDNLCINNFVYYVGRFNNELIVNEDLSYKSNGDWDGYIMKTDYEGELLSLFTYGSADLDAPANIVIDKTGNLFLASAFTNDFKGLPEILIISL